MLAILNLEKKVTNEAVREELKKALSIYHQAEQNFNYAEGDFFIEKSIYDLKSAEMNLIHILKRAKSENGNS